MDNSRAVLFEKVQNARDLGGIIIGDSQIKRGKLLRCASLSNATGEDILKLQKEYNPAYVVDFRMNHETEQSPDPKIPDTLNYSIPVLELENVPGFKADFFSHKKEISDNRLQKLIELTKSGLPDERLYLLFLHSDRGKKAYTTFFNLLIQLPEDKGIVWHCKDGKDRTGIAAMLLLSALGASNDVILEDYLLTNKQNEKTLSELRHKLDGVDIPESQKEIVLFISGGVYERYLLSAINWLKDNYGGALGYLSKECMVDEAAVRKLKEKFLV